MCSDGTAAGTERRFGEVTVIEDLHRCFIKEVAYVKNMSAELNSVLSGVRTVVTYVEVTVLISRSSSLLFCNMEADHKQLLRHEIRWFLRGKFCCECLNLE